jgi:hypothetical protein
MSAMQGAEGGESELAPPCLRELRVFGVVGGNDVWVDVAAGHACGD